MTLTTGTHLGPYEVVAKLGEGGMGVVWRATDSRLKREVALKVLPEAFTADPERLARFEREAQLLAQLHHPNIASIFGLEEEDGSRALVMELVEGEDLAQRIARGPLPLEEALAIARQVAEALEAAHEKGIVHRDLKPANVKLRPDGTVKVLDFGLAKAMEPAGTGSGSASQLAHSPTLSLGATQMGMVLGTAAYMAPEQAAGKAVDKRADVWAFGVMLYEMLTGARAFEAPTVPETLAQVLTRTPDLEALPAATPAAVRRLLRRCLERNPRNRLHDIADARLELAAAEEGEEAAGLETPSSRRGVVTWLGWSVAAVALALAAALAFQLVRRDGAAGQQVVRLDFVPAKGERLALGKLNELRPFAISPDGQTLVYAIEKGASSELRVRPLAAAGSTPIPGSEGATHPFFSPDGRWIAFAAGRKLKKVALAGGAPVALADAPHFRGGVWGADGTIYFVPNLYVPVSRIPAGGGTARPVTRIRSAEGELQHRWPDLLPGGKVLLYTVGYGADWDEAAIVAERLDTGERKVLVKGGTAPRYLGDGVLVYGRASGLYAVRLDPRTLEVSGAPVEVARNVYLDPTGSSYMDVARNGLLVTVPADAVGGASILSWLDRDGRGEPLEVPPQLYGGVALSPDGDRAALNIGNGISILDLQRLSLAKLTLERRGESPSWSRDGRRLFFGYEQGKSYQIYAKAADDSGVPQLVVPSDVQEDPLGASADGTRLIGQRAPPRGRPELVVHDLRDPRGAPRLLAASSGLAATSNATFSPDGRWVVYDSAESGRAEIYVRPASGEDRRWQVSVDGGTFPVWSPAGGEIFFLCGMQFFAAPVSEKGAELVIGEPKVLFANHEISAFGVTADGKRFLVAEDPNPGAQAALDVVLDWFAEVRRKLAEAATP